MIRLLLVLVMVATVTITTMCCTIGVDLPEMPDTLVMRHVFEDSYSQILLALPTNLCIDLEALDYFVLGTLGDDIEAGYTISRVLVDSIMLVVTLESGGTRHNYATPRVVWVREPAPSGQFLYPLTGRFE